MPLDMTTFIENFIIQPETTYKPTARQGSGMYASVFDSDMPNMVVKKGERTYSGTCLTDGWLVWAIYCMNRTQKHGVGWAFMPKIHGLVIDYETGKFHAVIEKLKERRKEEDSRSNGKPNFTGYLDHALTKDKFGDSWGSPVRYEAQIRKAFTEIQVWFRGQGIDETPIFIDGHNGNWMWRENLNRGHTLVFTDPFVVSSGFYEDSEEGALAYNKLLMKMAEGNPNIKIIGEPEV